MSGLSTQRCAPKVEGIWASKYGLGRRHLSLLLDKCTKSYIHRGFGVLVSIVAVGARSKENIKLKGAEQCLSLFVHNSADTNDAHKLTVVRSRARRSDNLEGYGKGREGKGRGCRGGCSPSYSTEVLVRVLRRLSHRATDLPRSQTKTSLLRVDASLP